MFESFGLVRAALRDEAQLRRQVRSQVQLGNEGVSYFKIATTGAWSLVPISFCTTQEVIVAASDWLA